LNLQNRKIIIILTLIIQHFITFHYS